MSFRGVPIPSGRRENLVVEIDKQPGYSPTEIFYSPKSSGTLFRQIIYYLSEYMYIKYRSKIRSMFH